VSWSVPQEDFVCTRSRFFGLDHGCGTGRMPETRNPTGQYLNRIEGASQP